MLSGSIIFFLLSTAAYSQVEAEVSCACDMVRHWKPHSLAKLNTENDSSSFFSTSTWTHCYNQSSILCFVRAMAEVLGSASAVLALMGAANTAVSTFITFFRGVRNVDETVSAFVRETQTHLLLIEAITQKMNEIPASSKQDAWLSPLWKPMKTTLRECRELVEELTTLFQKLNKETGNGVLQNSWAQLRLQFFKKDDIAALRAKIAAQQDNFQMAMVAMNWWVTNESNCRINILIFVGFRGLIRILTPESWRSLLSNSMRSWISCRMR